MAIGFRAKSNVDAHILTGTTSFAATKPAGTVSTDVLVASFAFTGSATVTAPSGWTAVANGVGTATMKAGAWWALGSVASLTFTWSNGGVTGDAGGTVSAFTGVDATTPVDATGTTASSTASLTVTAPAVTVVTANAWHLIATGVWNAATLSATGFSVADNTPATNQQGGTLYNTTPKSAGSTGTVAVTVSGSATGQVLTAIPFALRPAAGAAVVFPWDTNCPLPPAGPTRAVPY